MTLRNSKPVTHRAKGLSDALDGTNAFPGAMAVLQNLIPSPGTEGLFVPRPAVLGLAGSGGAEPTLWGAFTWGSSDWGGFAGVSGAAQISGLLGVGNLYYGMIAATTGPLAGKDAPFAYNVLTQMFLPIAIPGGAASLPDTPAATGEWTPPTLAVIGGRVVVTHPGFAGGLNPYFGWIDISGFSSTTLTGDTHGTTTIDNLSADAITFGWQVGMTFTDTTHADIPADTTIVAIAANGLSVTLSQAATGTHAGDAFTVAGGTSAAPLWGSGNMNGNPVLKVPVCVSNFNARAYMGVPGSGLIFSDPGSPCQRTNATQALTAQNGLDITALGGLPVNQTSGGILAALIGFQGDAEMQMVTGDPLTTNLSLNELGVGVGCLAPNTICHTPLGLTFIAPDGLRYINFFGNVSDPVGVGGKGVVEPFLNAVFPSRMAAAYNQDVFRVIVQNGAAPSQPFQDYWYHVSRKVWSGPHTFVYSLIQPYQGVPKHGFVLTSPTILASLFRSEATPTLETSYSEGGNTLNCVWKTCLLPDNGAMAENRVNETMIGLQLPSGVQARVDITDESGVSIDDVLLAAADQTPPTVWGAFAWGAAQWAGQQGYFIQYDIAWEELLVFKQAYFSVTMSAAAGAAIGNLYFRHQALGYRTQIWPFIATPVPPPVPPSIRAILTEGGIGITTEGGVPLWVEEGPPPPSHDILTEGGEAITTEDGTPLEFEE